MLDDGDRYAREQAALKLEELGVVDEQAVRLVFGEDDERDAAQRLLSRVIAAGGSDRLRSMAANHPDTRVRRSLKTLLPLADEAA